MKKQRLSQHGGKSPTSVANPVNSQNADANEDFGPSRWIPSALASSQSTLRHLLEAPLVEKTDAIDGSNGPGWFIELDQPVYHKVIDSATGGQVLRIMAAFTSDTPDWSPVYAGSTKPINEPKNLVKTGTKPSTVFVLLVTLSCRHWQNRGATGVIFDGHNPPHPYLKQVFKVEVNNLTGELTLTKVAVSAWSHESEGKRQGDGGAIASQFLAIHSNSAAPYGRFELTYQGSGGWSRLDIIVNDNAGHYKNTAPADLFERYKTITSNAPINDDQRNKDGSPVTINFRIKSTRP